MKTLLIVLQIVFAVTLAVSILLQSKGVGLSETFGGSGNVYSTKRGAEKFLFLATIVLAVLLVLNTLAFAFVR
ncbi:preprotein translocase subunit SecG [Candidatus Gracilibacteria bacterium CG17_big_fil_post_rev_8_21_14_2_50_48_13]|nr:MAG: preprotein translocase subunit SecG [Candidatus Gracilibacteria bacterium CG17_big_fil_post_rev_8_21_14_2_50_48_13]